jgi:hypothetical protein
MPTPVVCKVGELRLHGGQFTFSAAKAAEFAVPKGSDVQIGLRYDYTEGSMGKEKTRVAFSFAVGSDAPTRSEVKIGDTPMLPDAQMGFLSGTKKLAPGQHVGRFTVEADYGTSSWFGRALGKTKTFRHEGQFVLRVR